MPRAKKKYHYIYKITCKISGRYYIGMHSTSKLDDKYMGSGKRLKNSINYHGLENHYKEILEFLPDRESLKKREKEIVNEQEIIKNLCMNLIKGGQGGVSPEQQKINSEKGNKRKKELFDTDEEWVKIYRKNISEGIKKAYKEKGIFTGWLGKKHSEESKRKISETNSVRQQGENNSQYGTVWITKNGQTKKIKSIELKNFLQEGWKRGRK